MRIAGTVILYNPDDSVRTNIAAYHSAVERIYVFDNSEKPNEHLQKELKGLKNIVYETEGANKGIAAQLNRAATTAINEGFDWLLTMDQDSYFTTDVLQKYIDCCGKFVDVENTAVFGVNYEKNYDGDECVYVPSMHLITSGSLINLKTYKEVGGFNELLFIDQVDHEYCYKAVSRGFKCIQAANIYLHHSLGQTITGISLKTMKKTKRNLHSPIRMYYIVRNTLYVKKKFGKKFPAEIGLTTKDMFLRIKNNLLYGKDKMLLIKMIVKGYYDYVNSKMGKLK